MSLPHFLLPSASSSPSSTCASTFSALGPPFPPWPYAHTQTQSLVTFWNALCAADNVLGLAVNEAEVARTELEAALDESEGGQSEVRRKRRTEAGVALRCDAMSCGR